MGMSIRLGLLLLLLLFFGLVGIFPMKEKLMKKFKVCSRLLLLLLLLKY